MFPTKTMSRILGVSRSGYYAWRDRSPSARSIADAALTDRIKAIHADSRATYGAPRIHAELVDEGVQVGRKRIERLMKATGIAGVSRRKAARTTFRDERVRPACDLVDRNFSTRQTSSGSLILPTSRPGPGSSIWPLSGCLLTTHRRLGPQPEGPTRPRCPEHGADAKTTRRRDPSLRPGISIHLRRLRPQMQGSRRPAVHGVSWRRGQCDVRELLCHPRMRAARPAEVPDQGRSTHGHLPVHRGLDPGRRHSALGYQSPVNFFGH